MKRPIARVPVDDVTTTVDRPNRRQLLRSGAALAAGACALPSVLGRTSGAETPEPLFKISLAQWSLNRPLYRKELDHLEFAPLARNAFGIDAVEYVNSFFKDKARDTAYLREMKKRCDDHRVRSLLIMCDGEGALGDADKQKRAKAVENHYKWVEAAKYLGCHSIRVNAQSSGTYDEQVQRAADGLRTLTEYAAQHELNVIVENHGGLSSNGGWLAKVMKAVAHPRCGTLPDFGNFNLGDGKTYDRYKGVRELMPFAKAVSAKSNAFDSEGNETKTDYYRMLRIVLEANYHGYVGIEYEGKEDPMVGIRKTQRLLERVRDKLASA